MTSIFRIYRNLLSSIRPDFERRSTRDAPLRICLPYYNSFNSLLYREAKALTQAGFLVDIFCIRESQNIHYPSSYHGIRIFPVQSRPSRETSSVLYFFRLGLFFWKLFVYLTVNAVSKRYALLHITTPPDFLVFAALVPKFFGAKIIMDIHDIGPEFFMRRLHVSAHHPIVRVLRLLERLATRMSDHVIAVTDLWRDRLLSRSIPPSKCSVVLNVPDEDIFKRLSGQQKKDPNSFDIFYHGSLEEHFGVDTLLEALPLIRDRIPQVRLHIYGDGRLGADFRRFVEKIGLNGTVIFHGTVPFHELPAVLASADIGVVPTKGSVFSNEALSMKSLEYLSLGIPIVISETRAHRHYYDASMVKFFRPGDKNDLALAVQSLFENRSERESLVEKSQTFLEEHSWRVTKDIYLGVVQRLLSDRLFP